MYTKNKGTKKQGKITGMYRAVCSTHCITPPYIHGYKGRNYKGITGARITRSKQEQVGEHTATHTHNGRHRGQGTGQHSHSTTARAQRQQHTGAGIPHAQGTQRRKNKSVHNRTSRCAIVVAWSTREQTTRSPRTTPLAPLREDMAQGIRAYAVSSFVCRRGRGNAVGTTQTQNAMRGEEGAAFLPIKYKKFLPFRYAKQGRRLGNGSETEN